MKTDRTEKIILSLIALAITLMIALMCYWALFTANGTGVELPDPNVKPTSTVASPYEL